MGSAGDYWGWKSAIAAKARSLGRPMPHRVISSPSLRTWASGVGLSKLDTGALPNYWPGASDSLASKDWLNWVRGEEGFDDFTFGRPVSEHPEQSEIMARLDRIESLLVDALEAHRG